MLRPIQCRVTTRRTMAVTKRQSAACTSKLFELKAYHGFTGTVLAPIERSFSVTFIGHRGASRSTSRLVTLSTRTGSGDAVAGWCDMPYHGMVGIVIESAVYLRTSGAVPGVRGRVEWGGAEPSSNFSRYGLRKIRFCKSICGRSGQTA